MHKLFEEKIKNKIWFTDAVLVLVLLAIVLFVSYPAMAGVIYAGHDLLGLSGRIEGIKDAWECGQIFPVVMPYANNGYGYLEFMYPELFLLMPAFMIKCGASMVTALHVYIFIINSLTCVAGYFSVKTILDYQNCISGNNDKTVNCDCDRERILIRVTAALCAALYMLGQYRLSDIYIRAAIGEAMSMAFLPLAIAGTYHILAGNRKLWWMAVAGMSGLLNSHILSSMMIIPVVIIFAALYIRNIFADGRWKEAIYAVVCFFVVNSWFIIPFVRFYRFGLNTDALIFPDIESHTTLMMQVFATSAKEAGQDYLLISLGSVSMVVLIMTIVCIVLNVKCGKNDDDLSKSSMGRDLFKFLVITSVLFGIYLILSLDIMPLVWVKTTMPVIMKALNMLQFPYRLLTICSVCLMFMAALSVYGTEIFRKNIVSVAGIILVLGLIGSSALMHEYTSYTVGMMPSDAEFYKNVPDEYLPAGIDKTVFEDADAYIESESASIECLKNGTAVTVNYDSEEETTCSIPLLYYPCYRAYDENGNAIEVYQCENKRLGMILPQGSHSIKLKIKLYW